MLTLSFLQTCGPVSCVLDIAGLENLAQIFAQKRKAPRGGSPSGLHFIVSCLCQAARKDVNSQQLRPHRSVRVPSMCRHAACTVSAVLTLLLQTRIAACCESMTCCPTTDTAILR